MSQTHQQSSHRRVLNGVTAHVYAQIVTVLTQLVSLPIFLNKWSVDDYGIWLTLSAIPIYLTLADFGVLTHAGNSMTMYQARKDLVRVNAVLSAAIRTIAWMFSAIAMLGAVALVGISSFVEVAHSRVLLWLGLSALIASGSQLFDAAYRAFGRYPAITVILTTTRLVEWAASMIALLTIGTMEAVAFGLLLGRGASTVWTFRHAQRNFPELEWRLANSTNRDMRALLAQGYGFLAFPLGTAINLQGMLLLVGSIFGLAAVPIFSATRTITRMITQLAVLTGKALSPEISALYGARKHAEANALSARVFAVVIPGSIVLATVIGYAGEAILTYWSHGQLANDEVLLWSLITVALLSAMWQLDSVRLTATNNHQRIATMFFVVTLLTIPTSMLGAKLAGLPGLTSGLVVAELAMVLGTRWLTRQSA